MDVEKEVSKIKQAVAIKQLFEDTHQFNDTANNLSNVSPKLVDNQISVQYEEVVETIDAFEQRNSVELLDGVVDVIVVAFGLLQQLEAAGFDVVEACIRVGKNNLTKFPKELPSNLPHNHTITYNHSYNAYVIKNENGKIMKPEGYKSVDLSGLVPKKFF